MDPTKKHEANQAGYYTAKPLFSDNKKHAANYEDEPMTVIASPGPVTEKTAPEPPPATTAIVPATTAPATNSNNNKATTGMSEWNYSSNGGYGGYQQSFYGSSSGSTGGSSSGSTYKKPCDHYGDRLVYEAHGVKLYGANSYGIDEAMETADLVLDCGNVAKSPANFVLSSSPQEFQALNELVRRVPIVKLDWKDYGVPPVALPFWQKLWTLLKPGMKVVACCVGGHGRTGTCLSSLMVADGLSADEAMDNVRTKHCKKAVETKGQENYLRLLERQRTGAVVPVLDDEPEEPVKIAAVRGHKKDKKRNKKHPHAYKAKMQTKSQSKFWR